MLSLAISTIQSINYGNRLQNYALQSVLASLGYQVESLWKEKPSFPPLARRCLRKLFKNDPATRFWKFDGEHLYNRKEASSYRFLQPACLDLARLRTQFQLWKRPEWRRISTFLQCLFSGANDESFRRDKETLRCTRESLPFTAPITTGLFCRHMPCKQLSTV